MRYLLLLICIVFFSACSSEENPLEDETSSSDVLYFPPLVSSNWETTSIQELGWNENELDKLYDFLTDNNTRAFIILKDGKIVVEEYWGSNITNNGNFDQNSIWYWASAGKSLTAFLIGLAQQDGLLNINDKSSDYLEKNWTSIGEEKEDLITIKHQLSMTTGLDYDISNLDCTEPECLQYKIDAGQQWYYHNGPYTLLEKIISNAAGTSYNSYTDSQLESKIGMSGAWIQSGYNNVYWSKPRDAARFGLLMLNNGTWGNISLMTDTEYFSEMISSSQELNPSYGYLWWLNGEDAVIYPSLANTFNRSLAPNAPNDMFAAMGKNGQFINVIPSENMVVIRMGEAPNDALVPVTFHDEMWAILSEVTGHN